MFCKLTPQRLQAQGPAVVRRIQNAMSVVLALVNRS
jgi:hypothetical protein